MKVNAFIHQGALAALDPGERMTAVPLPLPGPVAVGNAQHFSMDLFHGDDRESPGNLPSALPGETHFEPDLASHPASALTSSSAGEYWSLFAVQTPGAPMLTIRLTSITAAMILWSSESAGFVLQQNTSLNPDHWVVAPQAVTDNGTNRFVIVEPLVGNRIYRLFKL